MSFITLTSLNTNTTHNGDALNNGGSFPAYNTNTNFSAVFPQPIIVAPDSSIRLNFASVYLKNDGVKRPIYITTTSFSGMDCYMSGLGKCGVLGIMRLDDPSGAVEPATKNSFVVDNSFPYVKLNNAEELFLSRIDIKIVSEDGSESNNVEGYTNDNVAVSTENQTTLGLQIIPSNFTEIN
jgi:hypothetical protein